MIAVFWLVITGSALFAYFLVDKMRDEEVAKKINDILEAGSIFQDDTPTPVVIRFSRNLGENSQQEYLDNVEDKIAECLIKNEKIPVVFIPRKIRKRVISGLLLIGREHERDMSEIFVLSCDAQQEIIKKTRLRSKKYIANLITARLSDLDGRDIIVEPHIVKNSYPAEDFFASIAKNLRAGIITAETTEPIEPVETAVAE